MEVTVIETHVFEQLIGALALLKIGVHLERSARESVQRASASLQEKIESLEKQLAFLMTERLEDCKD